MPSKPDRIRLAAIVKQYKGLYCEKWIAAARKFERAHNYLEASCSYAAARDSFGRRSSNWQCLEVFRRCSGAHALQHYPQLGLVLMGPPFYRQFDIPRISVPVPVQDGHALEPEGGWQDVGMLEYLRYYLLEHEDMAADYERLISRLACDIGSREGRSGDVDLGDFYFGLARQYGGHHRDTLFELAHGYLQAHDYDNALREFLLLRHWQMRLHVFEPAIWLEIADLHLYLGQALAGGRIVHDYALRCAQRPAKERLQLGRFAYSWATNHHPQPQLVALFEKYKLKH